MRITTESPFAFIRVHSRLFILFAAGWILSLGAHAAAQQSDGKAKSGETAAKSKPLVFDSQKEYGHTKLFGIEAEGSKFVYVFDRSGSMGENGGKPLREAKKQLLASINDLEERNQFYLVFYNDQPRLFNAGPVNGKLVFATDTNKKQAAQFVEGIQADGGTDHMAALSIAVRLHPDVIFLLTDGEEQDDLTAEDLKRVDRLNGGTS
ncbi:MAG TPA: VWA domain-containing protein, partial [Pirellulales bacterium]